MFVRNAAGRGVVYRKTIIEDNEQPVPKLRV